MKSVWRYCYLIYRGNCNVLCSFGRTVMKLSFKARKKKKREGCVVCGGVDDLEKLEEISSFQTPRLYHADCIVKVGDAPEEYSDWVLRQVGRIIGILSVNDKKRKESIKYIKENVGRFFGDEVIDGVRRIRVK